MGSNFLTSASGDQRAGREGKTAGISWESFFLTAMGRPQELAGPILPTGAALRAFDRVLNFGFFP
jgi:hypothetical protein